MPGSPSPRRSGPRGAAPGRDRHDRHPAIETVGLTEHFGNVIGVEDVSLRIEPGEGADPEQRAGLVARSDVGRGGIRR
ncbi:hypothetical protein GCM10025873_18920 [Demequina sediminis]|nr:hypothetical protein GCM10025873_18920 [Demequina sediminis]